MDYVLAGILVFAALVFVLYPLRKGFGVEVPVNESRETPTSKETAVISLIDELEMDFEMGNLSQEQYEYLNDKYQKKLSGLGISAEAKEGEVDVSLEDEIEAAVKKLREQKSLVCPQCGAPHRQNDRFCAQCGQRLSSTGCVS